MLIQAINNINNSIFSKTIKLGILNSIFEFNSVRLLYNAVKARDTETVNFLLENGANPFLLLYPPIKESSAFDLLSSMSSAAYNIDENKQCIISVISHALQFINDDNVDIFINSLKLAIRGNLDSYYDWKDTSYEFSTVLAHCIDMKIIPVRYLVKLFESINIDEYPALWPALKEIERAATPTRVLIGKETKMPPALTNIITDYLTGELKSPPVSETRNQSLLNHIYRSTLNLLNREALICPNDDKRHQQIKNKFLKPYKDLDTIFISRREDKVKSEIKVDVDLLIRIKSFLDDTKNFMLGSAANVPGIFHYFSRSATEWDNFEKQNKFVLKEFDDLLNKMNPVPMNPAK